MDLGIAGRKAIVGGASSGLGRACALALAREGVDVTIVARRAARLNEAAEAIRAETGARVTPVVTDIGTDEGRARVLDACPAPDILVTNTGGPPPGDFRGFDRAAWLKAVENNMLFAIFLIRDTLDGMVERKFGRVINITASTVKNPLPNMGLSSAARAGLTAFVAMVAREVAHHNVTINNLLPGEFKTERHTEIITNWSKQAGLSFAEMAQRRESAIPAKRFGTVEEFGAWCAFLASNHSGFLTGQNILLDGGKYPGVL